MQARHLRVRIGLGWRVRCEHMQPALGFCESGPPACPSIFAGVNSAGALHASDAGIILIVELIVRNVVFDQITPHLFRRPVSNRINLYQPKFFVPFNLAGTSAERSLIAANARNPGAKFAQLAAQGLNFS